MTIPKLATFCRIHTYLFAYVYKNIYIYIYYIHIYLYYIRIYECIYRLRMIIQLCPCELAHYPELPQLWPMTMTSYSWALGPLPKCWRFPKNTVVPVLCKINVSLLKNVAAIQCWEFNRFRFYLSVIWLQRNVLVMNMDTQKRWTKNKKLRSPNFWRKKSVTACTQFHPLPSLRSLHSSAQFLLSPGDQDWRRSAKPDPDPSIWVLNSGPRKPILRTTCLVARKYTCFFWKSEKQYLVEYTFPIEWFGMCLLVVARPATWIFCKQLWCFNDFSGFCLIKWRSFTDVENFETNHGVFSKGKPSLGTKPRDIILHDLTRLVTIVGFVPMPTRGRFKETTCITSKSTNPQ